MKLTYTVGYQASSSIKMQFSILYSCSQCGMRNYDQDQQLVLTGRASRSVLQNKDIGSEATKDLQNLVRDRLDEIKANDYRNLHLRCSCNACGKIPLWSGFVNIDSIKNQYSKVFNNRFVAMLTVFGAFFLLVMLTVPKFMIIPPLVVLAILSPLLYGKIRNNILEKKVMQLPEEELPQIQVTLKNN